MKVIIAFAVCLVAVCGLAVPPKGSIRAESCPYPNGSDTQIHVYNCGDSRFTLFKNETLLNYF